MQTHFTILDSTRYVRSLPNSRHIRIVRSASVVKKDVEAATTLAPSCKFVSFFLSVLASLANSTRADTASATLSSRSSSLKSSAMSPTSTDKTRLWKRWTIAPKFARFGNSCLFRMVAFSGLSWSPVQVIVAILLFERVQLAGGKDHGDIYSNKCVFLVVRFEGGMIHIKGPIIVEESPLTPVSKREIDMTHRHAKRGWIHSEIEFFILCVWSALKLGLIKLNAVLWRQRMLFTVSDEADEADKARKWRRNNLNLKARLCATQTSWRLLQRVSYLKRYIERLVGRWDLSRWLVQARLILKHRLSTLNSSKKVQYTPVMVLC